MATLKATPRTTAGTREARKLRAQGQIPGVLYGHGKGTVALTLDQHELDLVILHRERLLEVDIDGTSENALLKDIQYDPLGSDILHVDLTRVDLDESIEVTVPVALRGTPAGSVDGGVLNQVTSEIRVECTARAIPEDVRVQVTEMQLGDVLRLSDIELPEGARLLDEPGTILCNVTMVAEEEEAVEEEAAAEPEVIGEKKEEGEGEEEAGAEA